MKSFAVRIAGLVIVVSCGCGLASGAEEIQEEGGTHQHLKALEPLIGTWVMEWTATPASKPPATVKPRSYDHRARLRLYPSCPSSLENAKSGAVRAAGLIKSARQWGALCAGTGAGSGKPRRRGRSVPDGI